MNDEEIIAEEIKEWCIANCSKTHVFWTNGNSVRARNDKCDVPFLLITVGLKTIVNMWSHFELDLKDPLFFDTLYAFLLQKLS